MAYLTRGIGIYRQRVNFNEKRFYLTSRIIDCKLQYTDKTQITLTLQHVQCTDRYKLSNGHHGIRLGQENLNRFTRPNAPSSIFESGKKGNRTTTCAIKRV